MPRLIVAGSQEKTKGRLIDCCHIIPTGKSSESHEIKITIICVEINRKERTDITLPSYAQIGAACEKKKKQKPIAGLLVW